MKFELQIGGFSLSFGEEEKAMSATQAFASGNEDSSGGAVMSSGLQQSAWVYSCVTKLAEEVSGLRFRFLNGTEENENVIDSGPLVDLFNEPNPYTNRFQFWELLMHWLLLRGRAFIVAQDKSGAIVPLRPGRTSRIARLWILPSDNLRHDVRDHVLVGWDYRASHWDPVPSVYLQRDEVLFLRLVNPFDPWEGLSPLSIARVAAQTDFAAGKFMQGVMMNNADTGLIVTTDNQPTGEQIEQIKAALRDRRRQSGKTPPPLFLWGGAKIEKPTVSNVDLQFLENRKFSRQEICAIYKVPQEILGFTEDANRSVSDAMRLQFLEGRVAPLCDQLGAAVDRIVKTIDPGARGEFHVKGHPVMQAAQRARWDTAVKQFGLGVPLNVINRTLDLGLPKIAHGDKSFLPYSIQEVGADGVVQPEPAATEQPVNEMARIWDILQPKGVVMPKLKLHSTPHVCGPSASEYVASIAGSIKLKRSKLRNFFVAQQGRVLAKLESLEESKSAITTKAIEDVFDLVAENDQLWKSLGKLLRGDLEFGFAQIGAELGVGDINVPPTEAIEWLDARKNQLSEVNETTFTSIKETLQEGLAEGDTHQQLTDRVKEVYADASERRAETIATTETNTAVNGSRQMAMEEVGVERKGWGASNLEGVRASHLANETLSNAQNGIGIDELWPNGLMHPGDPAGEPGEVINCRCFGFAILGDKSAPPTRFLNYLTWTRGKGLPT